MIRLEEFGAAIRKRYAENLIAKRHIRAHDSADAAIDGDADIFWSAPIGSHHAVLEAKTAELVTFDCTLVMEWLNDGQHVERFRIETGARLSTAALSAMSVSIVSRR